jgi:hypothetical protein
MAGAEAGSPTVTQVARLGGAVNCIAIDRGRRRVLAWTLLGDIACLAATDGGGWATDRRAAAFYRSALTRFVARDDPVTAGAVFAGGTLYLTLAVEGGLKGDPDHWSVALAADPSRRSVRALARGAYTNQDPPDPTVVGRRFALVGFGNGVMAVELPSGRSHWVGDPESLADEYLAPGGVMYSPSNHRLVVHRVTMQGPGSIDVYELTRGCRVKSRTGRVVGRRERDRHPYERAVFAGDCLNPHTGELAYLVVQQQLPLSNEPKGGPTVRFADLYVGPPAGPARRYAVAGEVGVNVGPFDEERYRKYAVDECIAADPHRVFVRPLGPDRYLLGLFGGTLCVREPRAGRQATLYRLPSGITALKAGFDPGSYFVGLADGALLRARVPSVDVPGPR